nr:peptidoglycan-binding protein [Streptomyces sp. NBC_00830]
MAQYLLADLGYELAADGVFGRDMNPVVNDFQARNGIPVDPDCTFDRATWDALVPPSAGTPPGCPSWRFSTLLARNPGASAPGGIASLDCSDPQVTTDVSAVRCTP